MAVTVRSVPQILSGMIRRVLTNSPLTDVNSGSVISTILEAAAMSDYQNSLAVIKVLESSKLEALIGTDLDSKAIEMNLPNGVGGVGRKPATRSSGLITIGSAFTKKSTTFYLGKPAPYTGALTVYLQDCTNWPLSGQFYIGRGSSNEEGPLTYTSLVNSGGYYTVVLSGTTPLLKPHRYDESVILSQGGIRTVPAGTNVAVPPSDNSLQVQFSTDYSVKLLDGESEATVRVTCLEFGENGNVISGAIKSFSSTPFSGATVTNSLAFSNGSSAESDEQLRQRIRNYPATLSKGTSTAINASIQGLRDSVSGKTVTSVAIVEPVTIGEPAKCYIDDGTGLEPAFSGKSFENLLPYSSGRETLFKTSIAPITPCMIVGSNFEPFALIDGDIFTVIMDGIIETFTVYATDYVNLNSVSAAEIVNAFNTQAVNVAFRTTGGGKQVICFDMNGTSESLRAYAGTLTTVFGMPINEIRPLFLFQNNHLLSYKGATATLQTTDFPWTSLASTFTAHIQVDGVLQTFTVSDTDFSNLYRTSMASATPAQWVGVLKTKIAGVNIYVSQASGGGTVLVFKSWQSFSSSGSLEIFQIDPWVGGPGFMWNSTSVLSSVGSAADYEFNRLTGQIKLLNAPSIGDQITVASQYTRGQITSKSSPNGTFSLSVDANVGNPKMIIGFDGDYAIRTIATNASSNFTATTTANTNVVRLTADAGSLSAVSDIKTGDYIYLCRDSSLTSILPTSCIDLYRVKNRGTLSQFWIEVEGTASQVTAMVGLGTISISVTNFFAFKCNFTMPQIIDFLNAGALASIDTIVSVGNAQMIGGKLIKLSPRDFVLSSANFSESVSSVAVFAVIGNAKNLFSTGIQTSIQPHTASGSSSYVGTGFAKVLNIYAPTNPNAYYPKQGALYFDKTFTEILDQTTNPAINAASSITAYPIGLQELEITGRNAGLTNRVYNLNSIAPFDGFVRGNDVIYPRMQSTPTGSENIFNDSVSLRCEDLPFNFTDRLVVEMNQDPINGTSVISLFKKAAIQSMTDVSAGAPGTILTFTLKDPDDSNLPFFNNASAFKLFDFTDFNILFRSSGLHYVLDQDAFGQPIVPTGSDPRNAILLQNSQYGDSSKIKLSFMYPSAANLSVPVVSHLCYSENNQPINHLMVILTSGNTKGNYLYNYTITPSSLTGPTGAALVKLRLERSSISNPDINAGSTFIPGDILVIGGTQAYAGAFLIIATDPTWIDVLAPGIRAASYIPTTYQVGISPLFSVEKAPIAVSAMVTALNAYQPTNPIVTATAYCTDPGTVKVCFPTYITQGNTTPNTTLTTMNESIIYHSFSSYYGAKAHIYSYDYLLNEIKAVVQTTEPFLPTLSDRLNVPGYTNYNDEICYIIPSNLTSLNRWLNFTAVSSLTFSAEIDRVLNQSSIQVSAIETGSQGAVLITGLNADRLAGTLKNVPVEMTDGTFRFKTNYAIAQSAPRGEIVEIVNDQAVTMIRPYATAPSNILGSIYSYATPANSQSMEVYFRDTTNVVYKTSAGNVVKFIFTRSPSGYDVGGTNTVIVTKISDYIIKFQATGTNILAARVGDMMTLRFGSPFPSYMQAIDISGLTNDLTDNYYLGYPVVHVEDSQICYVIAPNIGSAIGAPVTVSLLAENDIYFTPMLIGEKNIRTNWKSGSKFSELTNPSEKLHYRIKPIGLGFVYAEFGSDSNLNNLDMQLAGMMVNTDDYIEFKTDFALANQGKFKIVAHNGRNALIFKNDNAIEELISNIGLEWGNQLTNITERKIRIWDADSLAVGHRITISAPVAGTVKWFGTAALGTWNITGIGLTSPVKIGETWPSNLTAAGIDREMNVYVTVYNPSATTMDVVDNNNIYPLGLSASSITFQEPTLTQGSTRVVGYKWIAGYGSSIDDSTLGEIFMAPRTSMYKLLPQYGTSIKALYKTSFPQTTSVGIDGYRFYTELIAECHKVIDGSTSNTIDYPGVRSAGSGVEVLAPLIRRITCSLSIIPNEGVSINSIKQSVKSVVASYVNGLGVGRAVILSEIIKSIQQIPGAKSVEISATNPVASNGSISVGSFEVARILSADDITL